MKQKLTTLLAFFQIILKKADFLITEVSFVSGVFNVFIFGSFPNL